MLLNLSPFQAYIVKNALRSYNTELLTSSDDWREFDNIFEQIADLSDTRSDAVVDNIITEDIRQQRQYGEENKNIGGQS